jgi:hypothetical protein
MKPQSTFFVFAFISTLLSHFFGCNKDPQDIPAEFTPFIRHVSTPVEYKEILPAPGGEKLPVPVSITGKQALEDLQMFEYLFTTSYSGYDYWQYKGVDFKSVFADIYNFVSAKDTVYSYEFEQQLSKIFKQIHDGHINFTGLGYNHAYRHKSVYYCDIVVEKTSEGKYKVIDSQSDRVAIGDWFTQENAETYLFKTLSPTGKNHYLVGVFSFDNTTSRELSFNGKRMKIPFHGSRLIYANFNDPEPFYIERKNDIPIVRVTGFGDALYPQMQKFMSSANDLKDENTIIVNLFYNGGGSSVFPQGFIKNLNGPVQWKTHWATLRSPAITGYYAQFDLSVMPDISPSYRNLISSHQKIHHYYRNTPVKSWEFASTEKQNTSGKYDGRLILLTNRRVLSAGEGMVGISRSVKNSILVGENTGGSAQFSSTCGYYLPQSKFIVNLPRQFILIPGLEECIGYLPDYWLDTMKPVKEVLNWLDNPDSYQFKYSVNYKEFQKRINVSPVLPKDVNIISPGSDLPVSIRDFSGTWSGVWDGILDNVLVVEKIDDDLKVEAIYSWGVAYQWNLNQPGWRRYRGKIDRQNLVLTDETNKITITYRLNPDGNLDATYQRPGIFSRCIMRKMQTK